MSDPNESQREPFIPQGDRPEVKISLDTPIQELRVRELAAILGTALGRGQGNTLPKDIKDFFDKPQPEVLKDVVKELKLEKFEKPEKIEKFEKNEKFEKIEKLEKNEIKDLKAEKIEHDLVFERPRGIPDPDPRLEQIIQVVGGLTRQVSQLADQVEELRKKIAG